MTWLYFTSSVAFDKFFNYSWVPVSIFIEVEQLLLTFKVAVTFKHSDECGYELNIAISLEKALHIMSGCCYY